MRNEIIPTDIPDVIVLQGGVTDSRGMFNRVYEPGAIAHDKWRNFAIAQVNMSWSLHSVLRGLHTQPGMRKILWVAQGLIYDVVVDLRAGYERQYIGVQLGMGMGICIPADCAHGFQVISPEATMVYMIDTPYDAGKERGYLWSDPAFNIWWPISQPILSARDKEHQCLKTSV